MNNYTEDYSTASQPKFLEKAEQKHEWHALKIEIDLTTGTTVKSRLIITAEKDLIDFWRRNGIYYNRYMDTAVGYRRGYKHELLCGNSLTILVHTQLF